MARILSIGVLQSALRMRNEALRRAGSEVSSCTSIETAKSLFSKNPYDLSSVSARIILGAAVFDDI